MIPLALALLLAQTAPPVAPLVVSATPGGPDWLHLVLSFGVVVAGFVGQKVGQWLVTSGQDYIDTKLKAAKHDELVPLVDAMAKGLKEGGHAPTQAAVQAAADARGVGDHTVIQQATATTGG